LKLEDIGNSQIANAIRDAMDIRKDAKDMEEEAAEMKKMANEILEPALNEIPDSKVETDDYRVSLVHQNRSSFDREKAKMNLVMKGVGATIVEQAFSDATTFGDELTIVKFDTIKRKG
jgi:hypothetical protein